MSEHNSIDSSATPDFQRSGTGDKLQSPVLTTSDSKNNALLNPRSCVTCRRRKVRCDKKDPCNNCAKAGIDCVFPGPGRAPRKPRKTQDPELLARLRRLEGVVQSLGAQVDDESPDPALEKQSSQPEPAQKGGRADGFFNTDPKKAINKVDKEFGRLVVEEGRSRYVSNSFWASLGDEVAEMRDILDDSPSEDEEIPSPDQSGSGASGTGSHHAFIFGYSSAAGSLRSLHPTPTQVFILWRVFKENVDPVVKIFHRPTLGRLHLEAAGNIDNISKINEAVLFSVYYAAITSLTHGQCLHLLGEDRDVLQKRYRFAAEQSQARAGFLNSSSLLLLQAFVLFLICVRRHDNTRFVWTLSGIATRTAVALGVHRDGTNFDLSPFETEMRRRTWWHICILDIRSAEDHGADPSIFDSTYDTRLPLNIDDTDITPEMTEPPEEKEGCTEMTFCLIRFEVSVTNRRLTYIPPGSGPCPARMSKLTNEEKEQLIENLQQRLEERYLKYCDMNIPIYWVAATIARLILAKMWLTVHHPLRREDRGKGMSSETRDRLFLTSTEVIEFSRLLESNENTARWGWLFHTYMQWHAVAYLLSELIVRPAGPDVDRAWRAIDSVYDGWTTDTSSQRRGMLWRPMRLLMQKALSVRQQQNQAKAAQWANLPCDPPDTSKSTNGGMPTLPQDFGKKVSGTPGVSDALGTTAMAFGLDLNSQVLINNASTQFNFNDPVQQPVDMTPAQRNLSDEEINNWLTTEPFRPANNEFPADMSWQGWDQLATDLQMGENDELFPAMDNNVGWL